MKFHCPECGAEIETEYSYCTCCGSLISSDVRRLLEVNIDIEKYETISTYEWSGWKKEIGTFEVMEMCRNQRDFTIATPDTKEGVDKAIRFFIILGARAYVKEDIISVEWR